MKAAWVAFGGILSSTAALAANGIAVTRGNDSNVYGNCVPSLVVENRSAETIDYLQVDIVLALRDGRQRTIELKSAYRGGVPAPIAPGTQATLRQQLDTSRALGVPCGEVSERRVSRTICETEHGTMCASSVVVQP
ncbi:hypothetical protein [Reyranella sp.]|uniref:hypothetical protein n=1 Tax=Reyranella sp. TaxID=1929291 RepID=UPI003BA8DCB4